MTVNVDAKLTGTDNLSPVLSKVEREIQKFGASIESNTRGIRKLENGFENMAIKATQLGGNMGVLADAVIEFAPGGFPVLAAVGGISLIISYFQGLDKQAEDSRKKIFDLRVEILRLKGLPINAEMLLATAANKVFTDAEKNVNKLQSEVGKLQTTLSDASLEDGMREGFAGVLFTKEKQLAAARENLEAVRQAAIKAGLTLQQTAIADEKTKENLRDKLEKEAAARKTEVELLIEVSKLRSLSIGEVNTLISAEGTMLSQLNAKNVSYATQIKLLTQLNAAQGAYVANLLKPLPPTPANTQTPASNRSFEVKPMSVSPIIEKKIADATAAQSKREAATAEQLTQDRMAKFEPYANAATDALSAMGEALANGENAFTAFGRSAAASISGILKALAKQNIVEGLSALGKAFFAASNPATAASAPGFFSSAGYHFAAAAAAGVGAGVAAAGASGGGGRGGGVGGAGGLNDSSLGSTEMGQGTITLNLTGGSILDMSNIDTQRSFLKALETLTNKRAIVIGA